MSDGAARRFSQSHEWVQSQGGSATVGISDYAQAQLGDVIYLELPAVGQRLEEGDKFGVIESVKAASDLYAPVSGEVSAVNDELKEHPEYVNQDPYGKGWILKLSSVKDNSRLFDQAGYDAFVEGQSH